MRLRASIRDRSGLATPGAGKTYAGAQLIVRLMRLGRRVGVTPTSHKAIHNLVAEIETAAREERFTFRGLKKGDAYDRPFVTTSGNQAHFSEPDEDVFLLAHVADARGCVPLHLRDLVRGAAPLGPRVRAAADRLTGPVRNGSSLASGSARGEPRLIGRGGRPDRGRARAIDRRDVHGLR